MSSPLASLGKTRRVPLPSEPVNSGRRGIKLYGDEDEVDMLNDGHGSEERISVPSCYGGIGAPVSRQGPVFHDSELMATMARKVQDLERQVKAQTDEMLSKDRKIRALEELVETLQEHKGQMSQQRQEELEAMCTQLQQQISEMEHCLRDIMDGFFPSELQRLYPDGVPFKGFTFLICKVGLQQATPWACSWNLSNRGGGGARAEELVLPLSPFLLCQVSDLRNQVYPESGLDPFPGEGRVVGWQRIRKPSVTMEHPGSRMTPEKFLNRLPKFVIRQGEVIDIRGPIRNTLQNCCPWPVPIQEIVVETPALAAERERNQESPESPAPPLSMLRIKSENGEQAFLLMMRPEDTVGDVRALLAQARSVWGQAGSCSGSLVPRPDLILSARSSGLWTQTPSRSSVHSRPQSTMRTHSRCRLLDWCPMQLCYCGQAGLCHLPPDPNLPPIRIKHLPPTLAAS
ncbi:UBX domain-containing protein 11 isoform 11-T14 [Molossus nigricans]